MLTMKTVTFIHSSVAKFSKGWNVFTTRWKKKKNESVAYHTSFKFWVSSSNIRAIQA